MFPRDSGLALRMLATLGVVMVANALFVSLVVALCAPWLAPVLRQAGQALGVPPAVRSLWWVPVVAVSLAVLLWAQFRYVRHETLSHVDATRVTAEERPDLYSRVTRLSNQGSTPVPAISIVDSDVPNSFALDGIGQPVIVVSEGLLSTLDGDELDAVLAHELAHLENRDATVMTLASFLPALTSDRYSLLSSLGPWSHSSVAWATGVGLLYVVGAVATGAPVFDSGYALRFAGGIAVAVVLGGVALGVFATLTAVAARRLSRYREFAADRAGVALTGDPATLAETLVRLDDSAARPPTTDKRLAYGPVHGLCLLPHGFHPDAAAPEDDEEFHVETRTHPPTSERVDRLQALVDG